MRNTVSPVHRHLPIFLILTANESDSRAIRIGPNELHIDDVKLYKDMYNQSSTYVKHDAFYAGFNTPHSVFAETIPSLHKERRRRLNPFFSRRAIGQLEDNARIDIRGKELHGNRLAAVNANAAENRPGFQGCLKVMQGSPRILPAPSGSP